MKFRFRKRKIIEKAFILMMFVLTIAPNTFFGYFGMCLFMVMLILNLLKGKPLKFSAFLFLELLFPLYMIWQLTMGIYSASSQLSGIKTLLITFTFNFCLYNYLKQVETTKAIEDYGLGVILGTIVLLVLYSRSILMKGGLDAGEYIGFSIFKIGGVAAVNIGWLNAIGIVLLWRNYLLYKNKITLNKSITMIIFVLLTGRRKILLFLTSSLLAGTYIFNSKKGVTSAIKTFFKVVMLATIAYVLVMNVPVLYEFIGKRLQYAVEYIFKKEGAYDSSINMRNNLLIMGLNAWKNSPVFGQGYNSFSVLYNNNSYYSHNNMIELLVTGGIVGLVIYYLPYFYLASAFVKLTIKKAARRWEYCYWLMNLIVFIILEYYQITYIYRSLTLFLVFLASIVKQENRTVE